MKRRCFSAQHLEGNALEGFLEWKDASRANASVLDGLPKGLAQELA